MRALQINFMGNFSIALDDHKIEDSSARTQKSWLLLAYLIYFHKRTPTQEELYRLCWGDGEEREDPANALRVIIHRARTVLNKLTVVDGHELLVRSKDGVRWNPDIPVVLDVQQFEELCVAGLSAGEDEERLAFLQQGIALYRGGFLEKYSAEPWVRSTAVYYHNLYIKAVQETLRVLAQLRRSEEAVVLCRKALALEPYSDELYCHLLRSLLELDRQKEAVAVYEEMRDVFISNFDVLPSEEARALYYKATLKLSDRTILMETLYDQLQEKDSRPGALVCDFDFFRTIYHITSRMISRSGAAVHMGLITLTSRSGEPLSKRSLELNMAHLRDQLQINLRKGDVLTQCSVSQFAILLQMANYENSCMVCERLIRAFFHKYPHASVKLGYVIQPVLPNP